MSGDHHAAAVLGTGAAAVLAGILLLLQALGTAVAWSLALPVLLVVVGLTTAAVGLLGARRHRAHPPT